MNIFIEGLQGSGKSTLLQKLSQKYPQYHVYREGDYCPVELAWCSYMTEEEYRAALEKFTSLEAEIRQRTVVETGYGQSGMESRHYIVEYTQIITDAPGFHRYMEQFEIYNGRKSLEELQRIVLARYENLPEAGAVESGQPGGIRPAVGVVAGAAPAAGTAGWFYECALFQNLTEELILFHQLSDEEILDFYWKLAQVLAKKTFRVYYLYNDSVADSIRQIRRERSDDQGKELWYPLMMANLRESPYGKAHGYRDFEDLIEHLEHRQRLEMRIIGELFKDRAVILPAKQYEDAALDV